MRNRLYALMLTIFVPAALLFPGGQDEAETTDAGSREDALELAESPMLTEMVEAGDLPPLAERLPNEPRVLEAVETLGLYGGDLNLVQRTGRDNAWMKRTISYENLVEFNRNWDDIVPNVASNFEVSPDGTTFTFTLREGMKWSDGQPFTADDVLFWYEDVLENEELYPAGSTWWWMEPGGERGVVRKIDDYTVEFSFDEPNGLFLIGLATENGVGPTSFAKHYASQFLPKYNDDLDQLVDAEGFDTWIDLFQSKSSDLNNAGQPTFKNPERPVLFPWWIQNPVGDTNRSIAVRNPYYWKVDTAGRQLPYIDRVVYDHMDPEVMLLRVLNGEVDFADRYIATLDNRATLVDNQERGDYRFVEEVETDMNTVMLILNLTHEDPVMREIFQNKDFRIGLSHAVNRQEIIDVVFVGQGEPWQGAPRPESRFYDEEYAKQYTEYDPDLANEFLDASGLTERDSDGFRLRPDGERLSITVEIGGIVGIETFGPTMELVQRYWADVGVDLQLRSLEQTLWTTRVGANTYDMIVDPGHKGLGEVIQEPRHYMPHSNNDWSNAWVAWWYNRQGVGLEYDPQEPPAAAKQQLELSDQLKVTADPEDQDELMREILAIGKEEFYVIGISLPPDGYGVASNSLRNVMDRFPRSFGYPTPAPIDLEHWFFDD